MRLSTFSKIFLSSLLTAFFSLSGTAQCAECTADTNCGLGGSMPAVCPEEAEPATAGEYYEHIMTFYIPNTVDDPSSGITATIVSVTITSVSGLPYGLGYSLDDEDGVYYPSQGQNYGCATLCGVPLLPGTYNVEIFITAAVTVMGFQMTQNESFPTIIVVNPGSSDAGSFTYDNGAGCGSLSVTFEAGITAPPPSITTYAWDFGNGQTSDQKNPPAINFDEPGQYDVSLTTSISEYRLQTVNLQNVGSGWNGDEDIFNQAPDPYFLLINGSGNTVYTSPSVDNTFSNIWANLNLPLDNPPYTLQFFDEDVLTSDDDLGTAQVNITLGEVPFSTGTGTVGMLTIALVPNTVVTDEITVTVFPMPDAGFSVSGNVLTCNDTNLPVYFWLKNGLVIPEQYGSSYTMTGGGVYSCMVQNEFGCEATSDSYLYCPPVIISYDAVAMELEVEPVYASYQWYFNGLPIEGATNNFISATVQGNYAVEITTSYGCATTSQVYTLTLDIYEDAFVPFNIFPNPADEYLSIQTAVRSKENSCRIFDISGKLVLEKELEAYQDNFRIDISPLPQGIYFIEIDNMHKRFIRR